jgi:uncharacterized LabA/DUF88 family protein
MVDKSKKQNNYAFIDSQNLNLSIKGQGWTLDFIKFRKYLSDKFGVKVAFLFIGHVNGNEALYTFLQKAGYLCIFKPTLEIKNGNEVKIKGNVDAELVLHAMIEWPNYEKSIIVSGDGDFHCLIEYSVSKNKLERLIIPNKFRFSSLLRKFNDHISFLNKTRDKLGR